MRLTTLSILFGLISYLPSYSQATVYFSYDAEDCAVGQYLPTNIWSPYAGDSQRGSCISNDTTPNGNNIVQFWWDPDGKNQGYSGLLNEVSFETIPTAQTTYYFAFFFRFDRINGIDIWPEGSGATESWDKAAEFVGNGTRWVISFGERGMGNQDHHFSVFVTNPSYHVNQSMEVWDSYYQNYNGYSKDNSIQLEYEKWHSLVFEMKWASDNTGKIAMYVNGIKVLDYANIKTVALPGTIDLLRFNGTIGQPAYNSPSHYRMFDAITFTDNLQDIIDRGFLLARPKPPFAY